MRDHLPSFTACVVAWARATASMTNVAALDPGDQVTRGLLPRPFSLAADVVALAGEVSPLLPQLAFLTSGGLFDHVVLRTAAIDDALARAVAGGVDQLVILGAGLDARAHRMSALRDATVFEVDHPASQRFKRRKAHPLNVMARDLRYVAVDFERDRLQDRLLDAGFEAGRPSFWIWEGVTPYLHRSAIEESLRAVRRLSAPRSELVATYVTDESVWARRRRVLTRGALHVVGEPLRSKFTPQQMADLVRQTGFDMVSDTHTPDWLKTYAPTAQRTHVRALERIVHARVTG